MGTLKLIEAVRGSCLASAWHQMRLLEAGGGAAPGGTGFTSSAVGLPGDGELQPQPDKQSTGCPLRQQTAGRALP